MNEVLTSSCSDVGLGGRGGRRRIVTLEDAKATDDTTSATKPKHSTGKRFRSRCICGLMHLLTYYLCGSALFWVGPESVEGNPTWQLAVVTVLTMAFSGAAIGSLYMATMMRPGKVPVASKAVYREKLGLTRDEDVPWCSFCDEVKPLEAHHCSTCGECVMGLDHHCVFINNCVGDDNKGYFVRFLITIAMCTAYLFVVGLALSMHRWTDHVEKAIFAACDVMIREDGLRHDLVDADVYLALWYACRGLWAAGDLRIWILTIVGLAVSIAVSCLGCMFVWNMSQGTTTLELKMQRREKEKSAV